MRRLFFAVLVAFAAFVAGAAPAGAAISDLTIDQTAIHLGDNRVRLTGTITCDDVEGFRITDATLVANQGQTVGVIEEPFQGECTGSPVQWTIVVVRVSGPAFQPGTQGEATVTARVRGDTETESRRVNIV